MIRAQWRKLGCKRCENWKQGNKRTFPNGYCLIGNINYGAVALEKVKRCNKK